MDSKVIKLAKKFYKNHKGITSASFFRLIRTSPHFDIIYTLLDGNQIAILCLLVGNLKDESETESLYNEIKSNMFTFSIVEIVNAENMATCSDCGGDGEIDCPNCNGEGDKICSDCRGNGVDREGRTCNNCSGDGSIDCDNCSQGYVSCGECNGYGEVVNEGYQDITQMYFVSFDRKLFDYLEIKKDGLDEISQKNFDSIIKSKKTFVTLSEDGSSDEFGNFIEGYYIFAGLDKEQEEFYFKNKFLGHMGRITSYI
jgi:hypothetical protein